MRRAHPLSPSGTVRQRMSALLGVKPDPPELTFLREAVGDELFGAAREVALCVPEAEQQLRAALVPPQPQRRGRPSGAAPDSGLHPRRRRVR